jgi:hypothetical protein
MKTSHLPSIVVLMAALTIGMAGITSDALAHGGHGAVAMAAMVVAAMVTAARSVMALALALATVRRAP